MSGEEVKYPKFFLTKNQTELFEQFRAKQDVIVEQRQKREGQGPNYGACGGAYVFEFCPTGVGMSVIIRNSLTSHSIDVTEW